ncbi:MAG TPA: T9SS type A sorting domain-containing protein [Candidatus Kapabacteria bacterium]|nr:T9SS type A sorting domain-containing protein [Candidatus Kapabacteria bacterium]
MKNFLAILLVIAILPICLISKTDKQLIDTQYQKMIKPISTSFIPKNIEPVNIYKTGDFPQSVGYKSLGYTNDAIFSLYYDATPFVYDPVSNSLIVVVSYRYTPTGATKMSDSLFLLYSNDYGLNWNRKNLAFSSIDVFTNPSLATVNPGNSVTNFNNLNHFVASRYFSGNNSYQAGGCYYTYSLNGEVQEWNEDKKPTSVQQWSNSRLNSYSSQNTQMVYRTGMLNPNDGYQYGNYGFGSFDFLTEGDYSAIPTAWATSKFKPSEQLSSSYNNKIYLDVDNDGILYAAVCNLFVSDPDNRTLGISRSTDNGTTWLDFEQLPVSLLNNYYANQTEAGAVGILIAYEEDGFTVTGEDAFSYVCKARILNSSRDAIIAQHIIEIYKKSGAWGVRKVADYGWFNEDGFSYSPLIVFDHNPDANSDIHMDSLDENYRGNEIQLSRTADGQYIIAKWLDWNTDRLIDVNYQLLNGDNIGSLYTTDVYMTYRHKDEDTWHATKNVTDDDLYNKVSYIPKVVPSINDVPLITLQSSENYVTTYPRYGYPSFLKQMLIDEVHQFIVFSNVTNLVGVENESPVKNFALYDVYPNPVTGNAEISFNLDKPTVSKLELFNSLGERVMLLQEGFLGTGTHGVNVNTANLTSGVYYYTLTVEGKTATKILCIAK